MIILKTMQVPGFGPGSKAWKASVLPGYTTPALVSNYILFYLLFYDVTSISYDLKVFLCVEFSYMFTV